MRRLSAFLGCIVTGAFAEIVEFKDILIPPSRSLEARYIFHVNAPVGPQVAAGATVMFKAFEIQWSNGKVGIGDYKPLQVSLIPRRVFWKLLVEENTDTFCTDERNIIMKDVRGCSVFNVAQKQSTFPITETGSYFLLISNCGNRSGATFTNGEVIVKQPHGYLPANKVATLSWMGWFALINAFLCVMWVIAVARHYKALVHVQKMIAACAVMALLEAVFAYVQYDEWNSTGTDRATLKSLSMFAYSLKYVVTLRMLMETAAGSGVVVEKLEVGIELKTDVVCSLFLMTQWIWKAIVGYKYSVMTITPTFLLVATIPGTMFWLFLFIWVYWTFRALSLQIQEKKLASEAVTLFINLRMVLVGSMLLAFVVLLVQLIDIMLSETPWNLQWVPYDAAPHSVYTLFLVSLMILWWPNANSRKLGYFNQVDQDENEKVVKDQAEDGMVHAEQIGVPEAEEL